MKEQAPLGRSRKTKRVNLWFTIQCRWSCIFCLPSPFMSCIVVTSWPDSVARNLLPSSHYLINHGIDEMWHLSATSAVGGGRDGLPDKPLVAIMFCRPNTRGVFMRHADRVAELINFIRSRELILNHSAATVTESRADLLHRYQSLPLAKGRRHWPQSDNSPDRISCILIGKTPEKIGQPSLTLPSIKLLNTSQTTTLYPPQISTARTGSLVY